MAQMVNLAQDLIRIHKVITRSLQVGLGKGTGYQKEGIPQQEELSGYSSYIQSLATVLDSHHTSEDLVIFPALQKIFPGAPYNRLSADHLEIEKLLSGLPPAITEISGNSPDHGLDSIIESLGKISEIWSPHIGLEESNFSEDKLNTALSQADQKKISEDSGKISQEHTKPPYLIIPFVLFNLEPEERAKMAANFPPTIMDEMVLKVWKEQWAPMKPFLLD